MNLLDILSTSPHYFCKKWIGATNENSNFDLRVYIIIIEQRKCLILSPWKVMWETGSYFNHQRIKVMNIKFYCNNTFYSLHHRQKFWLSPSVIWCQNHCSGPYLCTRIWVCRGNWPVKKAIVNLPITGPEQGYQHSFADITVSMCNWGSITSVTQATHYISSQIATLYLFLKKLM